MSRVKLSDGTQWPGFSQTGDAAWTARYGQECIDPTTLYHLAEVAEAYLQLLRQPTKVSAKQLAELRRRQRDG